MHLKELSHHLAGMMQPIKNGIRDMSDLAGLPMPEGMEDDGGGAMQVPKPPAVFRRTLNLQYVQSTVHPITHLVL